MMTRSACPWTLIAMLTGACAGEATGGRPDNGSAGSGSAGTGTAGDGAAGVGGGSGQGGTAGGGASAGAAGTGTAGSAGTGAVGGSSAGSGGQGGLGGSAGTAGAAGSAGSGGLAGTAGVPNLPDLRISDFIIYTPQALSTEGGKTGLKMCIQASGTTDGHIKGRNAGTIAVQAFEIGYGFALEDKTNPKYCIYSHPGPVEARTDFDVKPTAETCCFIEGVAGTYYATVATDPNGKTEEAVETNNTAFSSETFMVTAAP